MNYRHAYHAGNFADVMKHTLLVWLLRALERKPAPFAVLDTHAGAGAYDLASDEAQRTGEAASGILRVLDSPPPELADYVALVQHIGLYPGSPALIRALLRPSDRLICCELHPEEYGKLRRRTARDKQIFVHARDGYEAMAALLPTAEKRGLVLIDPPYEDDQEYARIVTALRTGLSRFPAGVFAAWYPIKHRAPVRAFHAALHEAGLRDILAAELLLRAPLDAARLNGCGLAVINPPWKFEAEAPALLRAVLSRVGNGEAGAGISVERLADE